MAEQEIGVVGLATMGENLARNLASHGARVVVYNRTRKRTDEFMSAHSASGDFRPAGSLEELARILEPPRAILLMVKAGSAVDDAIDSLAKVLQPGDTIIDGGNSLFHDTRRRAAAAEKAGLGFIGAGVSGGEEGALRGPSIMPGGTRESYRRVEAVFARMLSSQKALRVKAAGVLAGPNARASHKADSALLDDVRDALYASKIVAYAQGFEHLRAGSSEYGWDLDLGSLATIWRGGCIIRAQFLDRIKDAYGASP